MNRKTNYIDAAVGDFLRSQHEIRRTEVERAAAQAGLTPDELRQIMAGERRLGVGELFVFSRVLSLPTAAFYESVQSRCTM